MHKTCSCISLFWSSDAEIPPQCYEETMETTLRCLRVHTVSEGFIYQLKVFILFSIAKIQFKKLFYFLHYITSCKILTFCFSETSRSANGNKNLICRSERGHWPPKVIFWVVHLFFVSEK